MIEAPLYPRFVEPRLAEALADSPAVLIHGPRQCGKTTLARTSAASRGYPYVSFDDDAVRDAATADPMGFVADLPERVILDEVQRAPAIFAAMKLAIDRRRTPGRFLLTGSSQVLLVPALADSLAGRLETLRLHPLAQCELDRRPPDFLDALFGCGFAFEQRERMGKRLAQRIVAGGYPARAGASSQAGGGPTGTGTTSTPWSSATCGIWPTSARWRRCRGCWPSGRPGPPSSST